MIAEVSFWIDLLPMKTASARGADCFREQRKSIPLVPLWIFQTCKRETLFDGWKVAIMKNDMNERKSLTDMELWMMEWVRGENEIRFTSGVVSASGIEQNLCVPSGRDASSRGFLYWSSCNTNTPVQRAWMFTWVEKGLESGAADE